MQVANRPLNTPAQVSANQTLDDKAQKTRNRVDELFLVRNNREIRQFIDQLQAEVSSGNEVAGNYVKSLASQISGGDHALEKNLIQLFSKNLELDKTYTSQRLSEKVAQMESAINKNLTTPVDVPTTTVLESAINKFFENAQKSGVNLETKTTSDLGVKIDSLISNLEAIATALNSKQSVNSDAKGYFESFVSDQYKAINNQKLVKALNIVKASLAGSEEISAQALNDALGKIETFNAAAE